MAETWLSTSYLVNHIKSRLGASVRGLELDNDAIALVLKEETLRTLSLYFPKFIGYIVDIEKDQVGRDQGLYYIDTPTALLGVELILSMNGLGNYTYYDRTYSICPFEYILTYLQKEILDYTRVPTTCSFEPPNKVRVSPNPATMMGKKVVLKLKVAHSDFQEFHPGLLETIKKLALCDVKLDILGMRRIFNNINTSMSDIELSLGTYEEAETKRDDLLEKIRASMHLSANRRKIFVDNA